MLNCGAFLLYLCNLRAKIGPLKNFDWDNGTGAVPLIRANCNASTPVPTCPRTGVVSGTTCSRPRFETPVEGQMDTFSSHSRLGGRAFCPSTKTSLYATQSLHNKHYSNGFGAQVP